MKLGLRLGNVQLQGRNRECRLGSLSDYEKLPNIVARNSMHPACSQPRALASSSIKFSFGLGITFRHPRIWYPRGSAIGLAKTCPLIRTTVEKSRANYNGLKCE